MKNKYVRITVIVVGIVLGIIVIAAIIFGVYITHTDKVENVQHGVVRLPETTHDTGFLAEGFLAMITDNYDENTGKCSTVTKTLSNGDTVVGRNFDLILNKCPVYIGNTNIEGFYPTVYASQLKSVGPTYDSCVENGVPKYMSAIAPFAAGDSLNNEGLYIEQNMRNNQKDENGNFMFACSGTNNQSPIRLNAYELPSYVTMRCKNIEEALELINSINIYTTYNEQSWAISFTMADANGNYGLLELGSNEIKWLPRQSIQTNFYISENFNAIQKYKMGLGRYEYLEKNMNSVNTENEMLKLMEGVKYSEVYNLINPNYDIRSEFVGIQEYMTTEYLLDDANWSKWLEDYKEDVKYYHSISEDKREEANKYWNTIYATVANCNKKKLSLSIHEDFNITYVLGFD